VTSLRTAINDKCLDCIYDEEVPGGPTEQIHLCTAMDCPLWEVRKRLYLKDPKSAGTPTRLRKRLQEAGVPDHKAHQIIYGQSAEEGGENDSPNAN